MNEYALAVSVSRRNVNIIAHNTLIKSEKQEKSFIVLKHN